MEIKQPTVSYLDAQHALVLRARRLLSWMRRLRLVGALFLTGACVRLGTGNYVLSLIVGTFALSLLVASCYF